MKKNLFFITLIFSLLSACNSSEETTTYYLIRHAEKDKTDVTNRNPNLNEQGLKRAIKWSERFKNIHFDAIYSTNYNRTLETGTPTAVSKKIKILNYDPKNMYDSIFQKETKGKTVLIIGHSNTTPVFVNKILGEKKYKNMNENDNSTLFIVTINGDKKTSKTEKVN